VLSGVLPVYLDEHRNGPCRRLHLLGASLGLACLALAFRKGNPWWVLVGPQCGYGRVRVGHYVFENNRPATFTHPLHSFVGDWAMYAGIRRDRIRF
jgi:hypothetical protein